MRPKSVLIIEPSNGHEECLPGYAAYFMELGFNVDVLKVQPNSDTFHLFGQDRLSRLRVFTGLVDLAHMEDKQELKEKIRNYDIVFFNTWILHEGNTFFYEDDLFTLEMAKLPNLLAVVHGRYKHIPKLKNKPIALIRFITNGTPVNPHPYFLDVAQSNKHNPVAFIIVGWLENFRRNYQLLVDAVQDLSKKTENFYVTVTGYKQRPGENVLNVPDDIRKYFKYEGELNAEDLSAKLMDSDFCLMLLDPENHKHDRYITYYCAGSAQLVYGFRKPPIVHKKFAAPYGFDDSNSIVYDKKNLADAMYRAILMSQKKYNLMQKNLLSLSREIYRESLENLRKRVNSIMKKPQ
jgi:hypothetical protein